MEQVNITVTIQSPTLIANSSTAGVLTGTRGSIDGRILRGLFATQFIIPWTIEFAKKQECC